jgi:hypothetical protein
MKISKNIFLLSLLSSLLFFSNLSLGLDGKKSSLSFPLRGAFYYPWYPQTWTVDGAHVFYDVELGYYSSDDPNVVDQHIEDMDYAKIDVAIASWWGVDRQKEAQRIPMLLDQTLDAGSDLKWAIYYEKEGFGNPTIDEIQSDLDYVMENYAEHDAFARIDGKPVVFVYNADDKDCEVTERWAAASDGWYVNLKVFGGYKNCANQPDSWHQYGPSTHAQQHQPYAFGISPGFWRADEAEARLERDIDRWNKDVRDMVRSKEPWQLIQTFNEWGEGTAIERCLDWQSDSGYGLYLDALHFDGQPNTSVVSSDAPPTIFKVLQNYPNPFNPSTTIQYTLASPADVTLAIYNMQGKLITSLVEDYQSEGSYSVQWDVDGMAPPLSSGIYFCQLHVQSEKNTLIVTHKMMLIK